MLNTTSERLKAWHFLICWYFSFFEQLKFRAQLSWAWIFLNSVPRDNDQTRKATVDHLAKSAPNTKTLIWANLLQQNNNMFTVRNRGSYMSANVILSLLNEMRKREFSWAFYLFFATNIINSIIQEHECYNLFIILHYYHFEIIFWRVNVRGFHMRDVKGVISLRFPKICSSLVFYWFLNTGGKPRNYHEIVIT